MKRILWTASAIAFVVLMATPAVAECLTDVDRPGARVICQDTAPRHRTAKRIVRHQAKATRAVRAEQAAPQSGMIVSGKTGAKAYVAVAYRAIFQAYIDRLEGEGASIYYMHGIRSGHCSIPANKHPCGMALDTCQDSRGKVSGVRNCHLPSPARVAAIADDLGLLEGGVWCHSDYGHVEVRTPRQARGCGSRSLYAAADRTKTGVPVVREP